MAATVDGKKVLIEYYRSKRAGVKTYVYEDAYGRIDYEAEPYYVSQPRPIGAVVAIGRGKVGWVLFSSQEDYRTIINSSTSSMRTIAIARAKAGSCDDKEIPYALTGLVSKMLERSEKYFKE